MERLALWAGIEASEGHHFYARGLNQGSIVIDLGAHLGKFAHPVAARWSCSVYAVEASPALFARIPPASTLQTLNFAVGAVNGPVSFFLSNNPEANSVCRAMAGAWSAASPSEIQVPGITLDNLFKQLGIRGADMLKVDVEGAEIALFGSAPDDLLREIGQITVEFHDFVAEANLGSEVKRTIERLAELGFSALVFSLPGSHGDVLFLNRTKSALSRSESLCLYVLLPASLTLRNLCRRLIDRLRARLYG